MAKRKQRADDYNAWKERVLSKPPATFKQQRGSVPTKVIGGSNSASVTFGSTSASPAGGGTAPSVSSPKRTTTNGDVQPADGNVARPAWPRKRAKSNGSGSNGDSMNYGVLQASESKHVDEAAAGQTVVGSNGVDSGDRMQRRQSPNAGKRVSRSSPAAAVSSSVVANVDNDDAPTERKKHCGMRQLQLNFLRVGDKDTR